MPFLSIWNNAPSTSHCQLSIIYMYTEFFNTSLTSESEFGDGTSSRFEGECARGCDAKIKDENLLVIKIKDMRNEEVQSG